MRTRPILFSAPMVRALLAGTKTQTRRIVKPVPSCSDPDRAVPALLVQRTGHRGSYVVLDDEIGPAWRPAGGMPLEPYTWHERLSPYGEPGDKLWVKESIRRGPSGEEFGETFDSAHYIADGARTTLDTWPWKNKALPSIYMPRGLSRITLVVTDVRCEQLQSISEDDARAEGVTRTDGRWFDGARHAIKGTPKALPTARDAYATLWDEINGARAPWSSNPWVWVVEFKREVLP